MTAHQNIERLVDNFENAVAPKRTQPFSKTIADRAALLAAYDALIASNAVKARCIAELKSQIEDATQHETCYLVRNIGLLNCRIGELRGQRSALLAAFEAVGTAIDSITAAYPNTLSQSVTRELIIIRNRIDTVVSKIHEIEEEPDECFSNNGHLL